MRILFLNPDLNTNGLVSSLERHGCQLDFLIPLNHKQTDTLCKQFQSSYRASSFEHYVELLHNLCSKNNYDYIFPTHADSQTMLLSEINEKFSLPGIKILENNASDKSVYYEKMRSLGINCPETYMIVSEYETRVIPNGVRYPCVAKPVSGSGGMGVRILNNEKELRLFFAVPSLACKVPGRVFGRYIVEEYIEGRICSPLGIVKYGQVTIDYCQEIFPATGSFPTESGFALPADFSDALFEKIKQDITLFLAEMGLDNSPWCFDIIVQEDRHWFIDAGFRIGRNNQRMIEYAGERDYGWKIIERLILDKHSELNLSNAVVTGSLGLAEGVITNVHCKRPELADYLRLPEVSVSLSLDDLDVMRNGYAVVTDRTVAEALTKFSDLVNSISVDYE